MWLTKAHTSQEAPTSISGSSSLIEPMINVGTYKVAIIPNGWTVIKEMVKQLF